MLQFTTPPPKLTTQLNSQVTTLNMKPGNVQPSTFLMIRAQWLFRGFAPATVCRPCHVAIFRRLEAQFCCLYCCCSVLTGRLQWSSLCCLLLLA